jgi:hypothetical protein
MRAGGGRSSTTHHSIHTRCHPHPFSTSIRFQNNGVTSIRHRSPVRCRPPIRRISITNADANTLSQRHHPLYPLPPDHWIPTTDQAHFIPIPAPHERCILAFPTDLQLSAGISEPSPGIRARDFAFCAQDPNASAAGEVAGVIGLGWGRCRPHRNSLDSLNYTNYTSMDGALAARSRHFPA